MNTGGKQAYVIQRTVPTLAWGREGGGFHTRISLFNYYSLLSEDPPVSSRACIYLFDEDGREAGRKERTLGPREQWQFDLSSAVGDFQGSVAVQLIPDPFPQLRHERYVGTLFFATYWDAAGHYDYTHETDRMRFDDDESVQYESTPIPTSPSVEMSVILQSNYFGADADLCDPCCEVVVKGANGETLAEETLDLAPRSSRIVGLEAVLPDWRRRLGGQGGSVHVKGRHINQPMTFIRHASGDFNIHHF